VIRALGIGVSGVGAFLSLYHHNIEMAILFAILMVFWKMPPIDWRNK
jgi:hypothetical protein